ncbi:MAG: DUF1573 domain-containing protein [Bacteroidia bacterium]|nr:DUF1573 domain-containing protein [Bacteroidia bacterium]
MIKKSGIFWALMLVSLIKPLAQVNENEIKFESETYSFGTVNFGTTILNATFIFTNNSQTNFEIREVRASCGCTVPSWPDKPIAPGEKAVITATFDPSNLAGEVDKTIEIFANYNVIMSKILHIVGTIREPVSADLSKIYPGQFGYLVQSKNTIGFGYVVNTKSYTEEIMFVNEYNLPLKFTGVQRKPEYIDYQLSKEVLQPGDTAILTVTMNGEKVNDYGLINSSFVLKTNDRSYQYKAIKLAFFMQRDFSTLSKKERKMAPRAVLSQSQFDFGTLKEGAKLSQSFEVKNTGKTPLKILKVETTCGCAALNLTSDPIAPGEVRKAQITFDSIFINGQTEKEIVVFTNDPNNHVLRLFVRAEVLEQ